MDLCVAYISAAGTVCRWKTLVIQSVITLVKYRSEVKHKLKTSGSTILDLFYFSLAVNFVIGFFPKKNKRKTFLKLFFNKEITHGSLVLEDSLLRFSLNPHVISGGGLLVG